MKKVLITGGTGFVGANLAERLVNRGCDVRILRRAHSDLRAIAGIDVEHRVGDVRDVASLKNAIQGCDTVFHTAALVTFEKSKAELQYEVNVIGTRNVVGACLECNVEKLVHTSSIAAIGYPLNTNPSLPQNLANEKTPFNWEVTWGYKFTKHKAEAEVLAGVDSGLNAVIVNPSVIIGERDIHFHGGDLIRRVKKWHVPFYIEGGMNIVYVGDVVSGHISAAERGRTGERYILGGHNLTHKDAFTLTAQTVGGLAPLCKLPLPLLRAGATLVEAASKAIGIEPIITGALAAGAGKYNWFSIEKAQRELALATTPFEEIIKRAYYWYKENNLLA